MEDHPPTDPQSLVPDFSAEKPKGYRTPSREEALEIIMDIAMNGWSLRKAAFKRGCCPGHTSVVIDDDPKLAQRYARAREMRGEHLNELQMDIGLAAATGGEVEIDGEKRKIVDAQGARVATQAIQWGAARMSAKMTPTQRVSVNHTFTGSDEDLDNEIETLTERTIASMPDDDLDGDDDELGGDGA